MRNWISCLTLLLTTSCVSYPYVRANGDNFNEIKAGNRYTFYHANTNKIKMEVSSVDKDSIKGKWKNESLSIAKSDILEIKKPNTGGTVALVGGISGTIIVVTALSLKFLDGVEEVAAASSSK